jgi:hypothetical protein
MYTNSICGHLGCDAMYASSVCDILVVIPCMLVPFVGILVVEPCIVGGGTNILDGNLEELIMDTYCHRHLKVLSCM